MPVFSNIDEILKTLTKIDTFLGVKIKFCFSKLKFCLLLGTVISKTFIPFLLKTFFLRTINCCKNDYNLSQFYSISSV